MYPTPYTIVPYPLYYVCPTPYTTCIIVFILHTLVSKAILMLQVTGFVPPLDEILYTKQSLQSAVLIRLKAQELSTRLQNLLDYSRLSDKQDIFTGRATN